MPPDTNTKKTWHPVSAKTKRQVKKRKKEEGGAEYVPLNEALLNDIRMAWMLRK